MTIYQYARALSVLYRAVHMFEILPRLHTTRLLTRRAYVNISTHLRSTRNLPRRAYVDISTRPHGDDNKSVRAFLQLYV